MNTRTGSYRNSYINDENKNCIMREKHYKSSIKHREENYYYEPDDSTCCGNSYRRSSKNNRRRISGIIGNGLVGLAFAGVCLMFVLWVLGVEPKIVASGSMEPSIKVGSLCFVNTRANYEAIKEGDVIAYYAVDGSQVTHRVVEVTSEGLITKGDANQVQDGVMITPENFMGKTGLSIPYLGYMFAILQTTAGKIVIMAIVVIILGFQIFRSALEASYRKHKMMERRIPMTSGEESPVGGVAAGSGWE